MQVKVAPPFLFGTKVTSRVPGQLEMSVVVRAVFTLRPNAPLTPVESPVEAGPLSGDVFAPDDDDRAGALHHASDFADFKLAADVLLKGTCHPGKGRSVQVCEVRFAVGQWSKSLRVHGRRTWTDRIGDPITEPASFTSMPLTWENAFGGPELAKNPVGKGHKTPDLPAIEDPRHPIRSRRNAPEPAGFGPWSPSWPQRSGLVGKEYGSAWKKTRAPFYAADFDWSYFNAAPLDQRIDYLRGDEALVLEYLHPDAIRVETRLPGVRPRVLVRHTDGTTREVVMRLDTLLAEPDAARVVLLWRGLTPVAADDFADVRTLFIEGERLADPRSRDHYGAALDAFEADPQGRDALLPAGVKEQIASAEAAAQKAKAHADVAACAPAKPTDPLDRFAATVAAGGDDLTPEQRAESARSTASLKERLARDAGSIEDLQAKSSVPPTRAGALAAFAKVVAAARAFAVAHQQPTDRLDAAAAQLASLSEARESPTPSAPPLVEPGPGANLMERDLAGLDLRNRDLRGALLHGAKLAGAKLGGANLEGADLGEADLTEADLTGALLAQVNFTGARAPRAVFDAAKLSRAIFAKADLSGASLVAVEGEMTLFPETKLSGAVLQRARFHKAFFGKNDATGADFSGAELDVCTFLEVAAAGAIFAATALARTTFLGSTMPDAIFVEAEGSGNSWQGATLDRADFRYAVLPRSSFAQAKLDDGRLHAADLREGRFERASLVRADFSQANLFSASFNKAALSEAVFRGSSLYNAKFFGASAAARCDFSGANLKLAMWELP